ncbi:MAG: hemolysin III family protein [Bacteroidales bacterium]|nr:hemolysin III family protein [Bacteroidales bacterium]
MKEEFNSQENSISPDDFNKFVSTLKEEEKTEIDRIITRYINYEPAMAEAALHVAVDKGMISYDLKERLLNQVRLNFSKKAKAVKQDNWESNNAFNGYVAVYSDDDILNFIEDPADIIIDVYHAVLSEAKRRDLISPEEFEKIYHDALNSGDEDEDILRDIIKYRYSGFTTQDFQPKVKDPDEDEQEEEEEADYEKQKKEVDEFRERSGERLLLRGGISLTIAGSMMLVAYIALLFQGEFTEIVVLIVALVALGLGILLLWFFKQARKYNKEN